MNENQNEQEQQLYPITFTTGTIHTPYSQEQFFELPEHEQAAIYDRAMAEQMEWNDETIVAHPDWIWAARQLYPHVNPESTQGFQDRYQSQVLDDPYGGGLSAAERTIVRTRMSARPVEELSDEELGDWLFDHIGELNGNLSGLAVSAMDVQNDPQLARALNIGLMRYQNKGISRAGLGNVVEGIFQDPLTYLGVGGAVKGTSSLLGRGAISGLVSRRLTQVVTSGAAVGALEGATYSSADNIARQSIDNEASGDDEIDLGQVGNAAFWGAAIGGAFGLVLGDAVGLIQKGAQRLDDEASTAATNITSSVIDEVPQVLPRVEGMDVYNDLIPPSTLTDPSFNPMATPIVQEPARENLSRRLRDIESMDLPEGTGFDDGNRHKGAVMARQLRRWLASSDPQERSLARDVVFQDMSASSPAVRSQALQTLVDDSLSRIEDVHEQLRVERSRTTPDTPLIQALETRSAQENSLFFELEALSADFNSESGRNLRAIQGRTEESLNMAEASTETWIRQRAEQVRVQTLRNAEEGIEEAASETLRKGKPVVSSLVEFQRNSLLSAPKTFIANIAGPILNTTFEWIEEIAGAQGTRFRGEMSEIAMERLNGMSRFLDQSWAIGRMAVEEHRIVTGVDFIDGEDKLTRAISSQSYGLDSSSLGGRTVDFIGRGVRLPDGIQLFSDSFITSRLAISEVFAQARIKGRKKGLQGDELDNYVRQWVDDTFDPETGAIRNTELLDEVERTVARQRADRNASFFEKPTDALIAAGESVYRKHPLTRIMIPFWRTPLRLLQQGARRTPVLQQFSQSFRRDLSGQNGYRAYVRARGQFAMAQALAGFTVIATLNGQMKGEPHSVRDYRISAEGEDLDHRDSLGAFGYSNLDPVATPLRIISRVTEEMVYVSHLGDEEKFKDLEDRMSAAMTGLLSVVSAATIEQTMLQGFEDTLKAFQIATDADNPDTGGAIGRWFAQRAATFYPNILRKVEDMVDPEREQGTDFQTTLVAATGLRDAMESLANLDLPRVTTRRNILGEPIRTDAPFSMFGLLANEESDPVREELQEIMETSGVFLNPLRYRRSEANDIDLRYELTDDKSTTMFDAWQSNLAAIPEGGSQSYLRSALETLFETEAYREGTIGRAGRPGRKLMLTQEVFRSARERAWFQTLSENPEFYERYLRAQQRETRRSLQ